MRGKTDVTRTSSNVWLWVKQNRVWQISTRQCLLEDCARLLVAAFSAREKPVRRREFIQLLPGGAATVWPFRIAQAGSGAVTPEEFDTAYPKIQAWISEHIGRL